MAPNKTQPSDADVTAHLAAVMPPARAEQAIALDRLFQVVTGYRPRLWGGSIIGYGRYHYVYASGREGDFLATGFAARKAAFSIYIMPGYADFGSILNRLGPHRTGKSCLYVKSLSDIDTEALADLIRAGLDDLNQRWPVLPS